MNSIKSTLQITRTMEMISTARIQRALARAEEAEPYKDAITRMLANVAEAGFSTEQPLLAQRTEEKPRAVHRHRLRQGPGGRLQHRSAARGRV